MSFLYWIHDCRTQWVSIGLCASVLISCSAAENGSTSSSPAPSPVPLGATVQVRATPTDDGPLDQLHYRWAATDGQVTQVDSATTEWTLPVSSGLHFLYVQVSDGKGGFRERRVAVLTESAPATGGPTATPKPEVTTPSLGTSLFYTTNNGARNIYLPDVTLQRGNTKLGQTDFKGNVAVSGSGNVDCMLGTRTITNCMTLGNSTTFARAGQSLAWTTTNRILGHIRLSDNSYCGIHSEFFSPADRPCTVELWNQEKTTRLAGPFSINGYGDFFLPHSAPKNTPGVIRVLQENQIIHEFDVTVSGDETVVAAVEVQNQAPDVTLVATLNGSRVERPDVPQMTFGLPEMDQPMGDDIFLTFRGKDTRQSACAYYKAIGAVRDCGTDGTPQDAITLDSWKREHKLAPYNGSVHEHTATYINLYDLNLVRDMHAVRVNAKQIAFNVCNFPGPMDISGSGAPLKPGEEGQQNIDLAIDFARKGIGMLGCVAMDYWAPDETSETFVRFYSFGPSGELLLSVSLDGRREKFMPGTCVACHGGSRYAGRYPATNGPANIGSHFQPFDLANFGFSAQAGLTKTDQLATFHTLNKLVQEAESGIKDDPASQAISTLIKGWYDTNSDTPNEQYVPAAWQVNSDSLKKADDQNFYLEIMAHSCRTCHIAHTKNFETPANGNLNTDSAFLNDIFTSICGSENGADLIFSHAMPNALVPAYRLWHTSQRNILIDYANKRTTTSPCGTTPHPHPQAK